MVVSAECLAIALDKSFASYYRKVVGCGRTLRDGSCSELWTASFFDIYIC